MGPAGLRPRPDRLGWMEACGGPRGTWGGGGLSDRTAARVLALICALLALICAGLTLAYRDKVRQTACLRDAVELGLAPGGCP